MSIESPKPTSTAPPSSKKRFLSPNYKPKQSPNSQPGSSTIPEDDQLLFAHKKTRDLPNLSDCHGCSTRINHTNPQDRLLILDSVWRIVLLCRKCIKGVQLGFICPYCYKDCLNKECVKCGDCQRKIHRDCVLRYGESSPWFLCRRELGVGGEGEGFSVCLDCWVPEVLKRSIRIVRKKKAGRGEGKCRGGSVVRRGVGVLNDGGCSMGREVVLALMAPNYCGSNNGVARLDVANGDLEFGNGKRIGGLGGSGMICYKRLRVGKDVDGENRVGKSGDGESSGAMNELRYFPITYRTRDKKLEWRTYERGSLKRKIFLETIKDSASAEVVGISGPCHYKRGSLERKVFLENIKDLASAEAVGISGPCLYERGRLKRKVFLENIKDGASVEAAGISLPCVYERGSWKRKIFLENIKNASAEVVENTEISPSEVCNFKKLEHVNENKCTNQMERDSDPSKEMVSDNEDCDRYVLKYFKRQAIHKPQLSC